MDSISVGISREYFGRWDALYVPAILYHYDLIEPCEAFYGCKCVLGRVSVEVIDGVKRIIFVFSDCHRPPLSLPHRRSVHTRYTAGRRDELWEQGGVQQDPCSRGGLQWCRPGLMKQSSVTSRSPTSQCTVPARIQPGLSPSPPPPPLEDLSWDDDALSNVPSGIWCAVGWVI